jgi:hypothetical protein
MNKARLSMLAASLLTCLVPVCIQAQAGESIQLPVGTTIPAMLQKSVNARKSKIGDEVVAKTTEHVKSGGQVVLPKGSKVIGHVTMVKAGTKEEADSAVGVIFDHVILKDGREVPLVLTIQAIAPDAPMPPPSMAIAPSTARGGSGGMPDPDAGTPGRVESPENSAYAPPDDRLTSTGKLTPSCHGVLGIDGLALAREPGKAIGVLIVSQRRNVHLDGGTQLMLRVTGR